jgi:hypothetical protein
MQIYSAGKKIKGKKLDLLVLIYNHCCYTNSVAKTGKHYKITKPIPLLVLIYNHCCYTNSVAKTGKHYKITKPIPYKFSELKKFLKQQSKN